jgi:large subunit ribosomal protein L25
MKTLTLEGSVRKDLGKKNAQELRRQGLVPCNLYGGKENLNFTAPYNSFLKIIYNPDFFKVQVTVDGKQYDTLIKEVQFNPVTDRINHIDFLELVPGKKVNAEIPLKFVGQSEGVKDGGKFVQKMRKLKVKATPENLTEVIEVNIESLQMGKSVYVRDIQTNNIEIVNSPEIPVATVEVPRAAKAVEEPKPAAAAAPAATATPAAATPPAAAKPAAKK